MFCNCLGITRLQSFNQWLDAELPEQRAVVLSVPKIFPFPIIERKTGVANHLATQGQTILEGNFVFRHPIFVPLLEDTGKGLTVIFPIEATHHTLLPSGQFTLEPGEHFGLGSSQIGFFLHILL